MTFVELDGTLAWADKKFLPRGVAIYFLFDDHTVYYIGCTTQLYLRIQNHGHRKEFNQIPDLHIGWVAIRKTNPLRMRRLEGHLIRQFQPAFNVHIPKERNYA